MPAKKKPVRDGNGPARPGGARVHLAGFLRYLEAECGMSANTLTAYRTDLERFLEWFDEHGPGRLGDVELKVFSAYLRHLSESGLAPSSIARHLVSIKTFFRFLVLEGVLQESVVELLGSPKLWQHLPKVLSPQKVDELLKAPGNHDRYPLRDRAILATLYATGCRASEVTGIELRHLNLEEGYCRVLGKGNKERMVSLNPVARAAIERYLTHERPSLVTREDDPGWLFASRTGNQLSRIVIWNLVKKYAGRIGCSAEVSPHTLRHSFATHMLAGGAEIRALQEMLGHASVRTTQVYTHVDHGRLKAVHAKHHPRA